VKKLERPKVTKGETPRYRTGCGNVYITVNKVDGNVFEVFVSVGKAGGCAVCNLEAVARCVSLGLRCGIPVQEFIDELKELKCPGQMDGSNDTAYSCPDALARALQEAING